MSTLANFRKVDIILEEDSTDEEEVSTKASVDVIVNIKRDSPLPKQEEQQEVTSSDEIPLPALAKPETHVRILEPSADVLNSSDDLFPCPVCGRKFIEKTFQKHVKICEKVSTKKRKVFDGAKQRLEGLEDISLTRKSSADAKKKPSKPENEFQKCNFCSRNFGPKAYDRHVAWCEEKSRRMQCSPNKDLVALAKLQARKTYRPKTPSRKESSGSTGSGSTSQKTSFTKILGDTPQSSTSMTSTDGSDIWTRSLSREKSRKTSTPSGTRSLGRSGGISFLESVAHTKESPETQFIRAATGRGSIKRGPAPTKASLMRQQKSIDVIAHGPEEPIRAKTPNVPRRATSPVVPAPRKAASPGFHLQSSGQPNGYSNLIRPSAVRPSKKLPSYGLRREPEGIENVSDNKISETQRVIGPLSNVGQYDHSQEYDPYQSAARQMQELLFGTSSSASQPRQQDSANLRPSSNSAFQRYIPSPTVPSTADINSKFFQRSNGTSQKKSDPMRTSWDGSTASRGYQSSSNNNNHNKSWNEASGMTTSLHMPTVSRGSAKVAKFCHECGNPFALPDIRFCCECGVKRLYC